MKKLLILVALGLVGCGPDTGEQAMDRYRIVRDSGAAASERCDAANAVLQAYLADGRDKEYRYWRPFRDIDCIAAGLER